MHNKRDWSVELMRIMACLIVIGCHTIPGPISVGVGGEGIPAFKGIFEMFLG